MENTLTERIENLLKKMNVKFKKIGKRLFLFNIKGMNYGILSDEGTVMDVAYLSSDNESDDGKEFHDEKILIWIAENI